MIDPIVNDSYQLVTLSSAQPASQPTGMLWKEMILYDQVANNIINSAESRGAFLLTYDWG